MTPWIMFTKHLEGWSLNQIMAGLKRAGVQGADLCVRPGYPVDPENATAALPEAAKRFADKGLSIPLITTPGDFTDPTVDYAQPLFEACAAAGVKLVKLGYWYMQDDGYWKTVARCRKQLQGFAKLAEKTGVKALVHNHSGATMGLNSSSAWNLVKGFDPAHIGVFTDVGHLSIVGEPYPMAFDIVKPYISAFAFKDLIRQKFMSGNDAVWQIDVVPMGMGYGNFPQVMQLIEDLDLQVPISFHCEYSRLPADSVVEQCRIDTRYIQSIVDGLK